MFKVEFWTTSNAVEQSFTHACLYVLLVSDMIQFLLKVSHYFTDLEPMTQKFWLETLNEKETLKKDKSPEVTLMYSKCIDLFIYFIYFFSKDFAIFVLVLSTSCNISLHTLYLTLFMYSNIYSSLGHIWSSILHHTVAVIKLSCCDWKIITNNQRFCCYL